MSLERPSNGTPDLGIQDTEMPEITHVPTDIDVVNGSLEEIDRGDAEEYERQQEIQRIIDGGKPTKDPRELPEHPTLL